MNTKLPVLLLIAILMFIVAGCASKAPTVEPEPPVAVFETPAPAPVEPVAVKEPEPEVVAEVIPPAPKPVPPTDKAVVYFDYDSSSLGNNAQDVIATNLQFLEENPEYKIVIQGHADERGSDAYNQNLGESRAQALTKALLANGLDSSRIGSISFGEKIPAVKGHSEEAWRSNRRAVIVYVEGDLQQAIAQQKINAASFAFDN